jgi:hypothetical protein
VEFFCRYFQSNLKSQFLMKALFFFKKKIHSIVAHSMGAVIVRAGLMSPLSKPFRHLLHTFASFSGVHLGTACAKGGMVEAGVWMLKTWTGSTSLSQISMTDSTNPTECFLYRLSQHPGTSHLFFFFFLLLLNQFKTQNS